MSLSYRSSKPCPWVEPRPVQDPSMRFKTHGPIVPLHRPSLLERLVRRVL